MTKKKLVDLPIVFDGQTTNETDDDKDKNEPMRVEKFIVRIKKVKRFIKWSKMSDV